MPKKTLYCITFTNQDEVYEIYARKISESDVFGFLVVEDFVFDENTSLVIDPSEERLKLEFSKVKRMFIPMHSVLRFDEVIGKEGLAKVHDRVQGDGTVSLFPSPLARKE